MPRTKLDRLSESPATYRCAANRAIRTAMARSDVDSQKKLGDLLGLSQTQVCNRFKNGWSDFELFRLNRLLQFTPDEREKLLGGGR